MFGKISPYWLKQYLKDGHVKKYCKIPICRYCKKSGHLKMDCPSMYYHECKSNDYIYSLFVGKKGESSEQQLKDRESWSTPAETHEQEVDIVN